MTTTNKPPWQKALDYARDRFSTELIEGDPHCAFVDHADGTVTMAMLDLHGFELGIALRDLADGNDSRRPATGMAFIAEQYGVLQEEGSARPVGNFKYDPRARELLAVHYEDRTGVKRSWRAAITRDDKQRSLGPWEEKDTTGMSGRMVGWFPETRPDGVIQL